MSQMVRLLLVYGVFLCICLVAGEQPRKSVSNFVRTGAVLSGSGYTSGMTEAYRGYKLFIDMVNSLNDGEGMEIPVRDGTPLYKIKFSFERLDDQSDSSLHEKYLVDLLDNSKVHILFGSHPAYAMQETALSNSRSVFNLHCCVEPDEVYEQGFKYVFGVPASNLKYTELIIRTLSLHNVQSLGIIYERENSFTRTTCEAASAYALDFQKVSDESSVKLYTSYNISKGLHKDIFNNFAIETKKKGIEALIACLFEEDGKMLVDAMHENEYPLKAFFLTAGPTQQAWVNSFRPEYRADSLLSAAQWHKELKLYDSFYGTTFEFTERYQSAFNVTEDPTYLTAGASAMGYVLYRALREAFISCDLSLTGGDIDQIFYNASAIECSDKDTKNGYDRVREVMKGIDINTFFGRVKFNPFQRNMGMDPITTQVFRVDAGITYREINSVLPTGYASAVLKFPARNYYKPDCTEGYHKSGNEFDPCMPCTEGQISFQINAEHCDHCPLGSWVSNPGQRECIPCPKGSTTLMQGATSISNCTCQRGYYHPSGLGDGTECLPCPYGALCPGQSEMPIPNYGYWANEILLNTMYECDPLKVCLGGENITCKKGYTGRLCADCLDGYFNLFDSCHDCISTGLTFVMIIVLVLSWYIINVIVSRNVASLEMMLSWAQLANIIGDLNLKWPSKLTTMFGIANILDFDVDILEPSCLINWTFTQNLIVQLLLPFLMSGMAVFGFLSSLLVFQLSQWHRDTTVRFIKNWLKWLVKVPHNKEELKVRWDKTLATFMSSVEVTYVTICKYCFDVFKCEMIGGVYVLKTSPDIKCQTKQHNILIALGLLGIIFYIVGYVALISWKLYSLNTKRTFSNAVDLRRFGFVYRRFELDYYYTPILILARRLLFVFILVYINNPAFQAGALAVIINASLMIHVYTAPYIDTYLDVLFSFLLITLMFEAFGGLMFSSELLTETDRIILEWIVLFTLFILIAVFIIIFIMEIRKLFAVRYLKTLHIKVVTGRSSSIEPDLTKESNKKTGFISRFALPKICSLDKAQKEVSHELLETFNPEFIYKAMKEKPEYMHYWDKLTNLLNSYMCDQSATSYLSMEPIAKFWRKLVDRFPELVDFLAVADNETRASFNSFAINLYRNFYLTNKVVPLPIIGILNWRDYAPMAQWLAIAEDEDRKFFLDFIIMMFKASGKEELAVALETQLQNGGKLTSLNDRSIGKHISAKKKRILSDIESGSNPLQHSGLYQMQTTVNAVKTTVRLKRLTESFKMVMQPRSFSQRKAEDKEEAASQSLNSEEGDKFKHGAISELVEEGEE